eukprot:1108797_1
MASVSGTRLASVSERMTPAPVTDENSPPKPLSLSCMFDEPTPPAQKNVRQSVMPALMRDEDAVPKKKKLKYAQQKIDLYYRPKKFKRQPLTPMELNMERSDDWNPYFNRSRAPKLIKDADSKTRKPTLSNQHSQNHNGSQKPSQPTTIESLLTLRLNLWTPPDH